MPAKDWHARETAIHNIPKSDIFVSCHSNASLGQSMKIQYFGDVNDYRKYALLRAFAQAGLKVGVCWIMTEADGRSDGKNRTYLAKPDQWRGFDPDLFDALSTVPAEPTRADLQRLEASDAIPGAVYFNNMAPDGLSDRRRWHAHAMGELTNADLVFFDPDNGFEIASCPKGRARSNKFVFFDEMVDHYRAGRSVLVYQHFPRTQRDEFILNLCEKMKTTLDNASILYFRTANVVFMLGARPDHYNNFLKKLFNKFDSFSSKPFRMTSHRI